MSRMCGEAPGAGLQGSAGPARRTAGRRGPCRTAYPSQWLGKVRTVLANPRLAHVHPITDSNIPSRGQLTSPAGGGSAEVGNLFLRGHVCVGGVVI